MTASTLTHKGLQVPWVTRWTNEIPSDARLDVTLDKGRLKLRYADGIEYRDKHGVLWQREGIARGGEPEFAHVSAHRQRLCMNKQKCQVCGQRITDRPLRWLMDPGQLRTSDDDGTALTVSPPTCGSCVDVALQACPHLRTHDKLILKVLEYRIWGVWGDVVRVASEESETGLQRAKGVYVSYEWPHLGSVVAKQQVAQLTKFTTTSLGAEK